VATQGPALKTVSIRVEPDFYERFNLAAEAAHRTMSGELRHLMAERIAEFERQAAEAA